MPSKPKEQSAELAQLSAAVRDCADDRGGFDHDRCMQLLDQALLAAEARGERRAAKQMHDAWARQLAMVPDGRPERIMLAAFSEILRQLAEAKRHG